MRRDSADMVTYYTEKYGDRVLERLEEAAAFWEAEGNLHYRNRLLRVRDRILLAAEDPSPISDEEPKWKRA
ncbi:hypothetical protein [Sneathiella limimaris]|uniref:hypothetical protein n=1 Tax=Sneathiella limimaris TaxID=1964213 RepID=UPI00146CAB6C|nr:hypothetical protein [Sneathiella limimaris]